MKNINKNTKTRLTRILKGAKNNSPRAFTELVRLLRQLENKDMLGDNIYHTLGIDDPCLYGCEQIIVARAIEEI